MTPQCFLGKYQFTVNGDFKNATFAGDHLPRPDKYLDLTHIQNFVRQTDGARGMVSNCTVFNRNIHDPVLHDCASR
jgi:hypothetical protein